MAGASELRQAGRGVNASSFAIASLSLAALASEAVSPTRAETTPGAAFPRTGRSGGSTLKQAGLPQMVSASAEI